MLRRMACNWFGLALPVAALAIAGFATISSAQDKKETGGKDIVETAMASDKHKTLCSLLDKADLTKALKEKGPFTVFAPTDDAFKKLDKATLDELAKPENKGKLADILKYHVVPGKQMAADLTKMDGKEVTTLHGGKAKVAAKDGKVMVGGATVTAADVAASNGVIHVVDTVMMPPAGHDHAKPAAKPADKPADKPAAAPAAGDKPKAGGGH